MFTIIRNISSLKHLVFAVFVFPIHSLSAQYFEFKWSDKIEYSNGKNGFFAGFIQTNFQNIYVLNSNYAVSPLNQNKQLTIVAYNKATMAEVASVHLKGYPDNEASSIEYAALNYHKTVVLEDRVIVFWTKLINSDSTKTEELYAESFKANLEREKKLKRVYTSVQNMDSRPSQFSPSTVVIAASKETSRIVIGSEIIQKDHELVFQYLLLNDQLATSNENQIILPTFLTAKPIGVLSKYDFGKDGNLYIRTNASLSREDQKKLRPTDAKSFLILTVLDPLSKKFSTLELKGENKTITDFSYTITGTKTRVFGFFGDLSKDPSGIDKQGIFYTEIDSDTLITVPLYYSYFEKTTLNKLFPKSKGGRKKINDADKPSQEEELNTRFDIENIFLMDDGSCVLFFTRKYNYSEITSTSGLDGKNIYKTDYYCEKNNVSAVRITDKGKILWTSNIDRNITYNGTDIADLKVIFKLDKFYAIYPSETEGGKPAKSDRKASEYSDNINYTTFDPSSGRSKQFNLAVNEDEVQKKDLKAVNPKAMHVFDDSFYFNRMIVKKKLAWTIANVLCFPSIYYSVLSGNIKRGGGEFGALHLMEGKPPKKKKGKK
jgi:hypothetical protein